MLKSMTGYGKGMAAGDDFKVTIDIRSVNNRNLDIHWRAPQELAAVEIPLKKQVQAAVTRGRVDVTISFTQTAGLACELNRAMVRGYIEALRVMREEFRCAGEVDVATIARLPGVLQPASEENKLSEAIVQGAETDLTPPLTG